jgi:Mrp family chromosome partitioning ATPase/capsular polysaccharide biosynthesis protein
MEKTNLPQPRIADYVRPLTSRKWLILLAVVLATGGVYAYYRHLPDVYTANTMVYVRDLGDPVTGVQNPVGTDRQVQDDASLLDSRGTASLVAGKIGWQGTPGDLLNHVALSSRPGEDFVEVTATGTSARQAANIANGFGNEFASLVNGGQTVRIAAALKLTQQELNSLGTGVGNAIERSDLTAQLDRLTLAQQDPVTSSLLVQNALPPASPTSPTPVKNSLFALAVSLVLAIGVAYGLERFDRRLKNPEEMEDAYGSPLLAVLPHTSEPTGADHGEAVLSSDFREPFRVLRTNVELASLDLKPRTLVVTSAMPGEGKSTVVRNLALAIHEAGKSVAVVGLDLRHPSLPAMFGVLNGPGLTEVLRHEAEIDDVALEITTGAPGIDELLRSSNGNARATANGNGNGTSSNRPGIMLLMSGRRPANPPAVLASARLIDVLDELRDRYDVVVIDSAPLLAVTDTVPVLRYADATLLVGRLGVTTRDTARRLMEFVDRVPDMSLLGVVANDLPRADAESYGYGYGYGYGAYKDDPERSNGKGKGKGKKSAGAKAPSEAEVEPARQTV